MSEVKQQHARSGFTLIELSIVLVIIGLIVGGVLVGQDLIKAAEIRATISQVEKYDAAVNTFRIKYNGLPGDIANAANFGLAATGQGTNTGNGIINNASTTANVFDAESALFFPHLRAANLIAEATTQADGTIANVDDETLFAPAAKMGKGNRFYPYNVTSLNQYFVAGGTVENGVLTAADAITPNEAFQIDVKVDDGIPTTGRMIAVTNSATADASNTTATAGECVDVNGAGTADDMYFTDNTTTADVNGCLVRIRASF